MLGVSEWGFIRVLGRKCITGRGFSTSKTHKHKPMFSFSLLFLVGFYVPLALFLAQNMEAALARFLTKKIGNYYYQSLPVQKLAVFHATFFQSIPEKHLIPPDLKIDC